MLDRRRFLTRVAGGLLGSVVAPRQAASQALADRVSVLTAGGTNVLAFSTPEGLVLVDSGAPGRVDALLTSVRQLPGGGRVRTVFNTHYHPENTGANEALAQGGAAIVAHENTRLWMATPVWNPAEDRYRPPRPKAALPTETFYESGVLEVGGERIEYGYKIEAHTSGDIYVYFPEANVIAVGDLASPVRDPELDYFTGAWIGGRADAMAQVMALTNLETRFVPGFGPVMSRAEFEAEHDMMRTVYERSADRVREGDDANDMLDAGVLKGLARTWKDPKRFLYDVQKGLWAHHNKLSPNVV